MNTMTTTKTTPMRRENDDPFVRRLLDAGTFPTEKEIVRAKFREAIADEANMEAYYEETLRLLDPKARRVLERLKAEHS